MKILVIASMMPHVSSPERAHTLLLCEHLTAAGNDVHLLTTNHDDLTEVTAFTVHQALYGWGWGDMIPISRFLKKLKPDAILLIYLGWIYDYEPMVTFLPTLSKAVLPHTPVVTQFENVQGAKPCEGRRKLWQQAMTLLAGVRRVHPNYGTLLKHSTRIIALAEQHRAELEALDPVARPKLEVIPAPPVLHIAPEDGGRTRQKGRQRLGVAENETLFAFFGFLYWSKGVETLLSAFALLKARTNSIRLAIIGGVGDGDYDIELKSRAAALGIEDSLIWTGFCEGEIASQYVRAADICVLPFDAGIRLNNSSFAVAAAHGLPIITTRGETLEPAFKHERNVLLCPPKNPEALADAMQRLLEDPQERECLRTGALQLMEDHFSWERVTAQTLKALGS